MLEVLLVGIGERTHLQVEIVAVGSAVLKWKRKGRRRRVAFTLVKAHIKAEAVGQHEGAIVIDVVAQVIIGHGRLRRHGHQRGMRIDHAGRGVKTGLRNAPHADLAGVSRDILHQPVDGVPGIRALVDLFAAPAGEVFAAVLRGRISTYLPSLMKRPRTSW